LREPGTSPGFQADSMVARDAKRIVFRSGGKALVADERPTDLRPRREPRGNPSRANPCALGGSVWLVRYGSGPGFGVWPGPGLCLKSSPVAVLRAEKGLRRSLENRACHVFSVKDPDCRESKTNPSRKRPLPPSSPPSRPRSHRDHFRTCGSRSHAFLRASLGKRENVKASIPTQSFGDGIGA
jgi:hypothetical protein